MTKTFRSLAWSRLFKTIYQAVGGGPWSEELEAEVEAFYLKFNAAVAASADVADLLDRPLPPHLLREADHEEISF
jgi:hypothetical protein